MGSLKLHEISEFERERFRLKLMGELESLNEIRDMIEESLSQEDSGISDFYQQKARVIKLESELKAKIQQIEVDQHLQMLTITLSDLKKLDKKLKKRLVTKIDPEKIQEKLSFLQGRLEEEIYQEECGIKSGFKSFPITPQEVEALISIQAI